MSVFKKSGALLANAVLAVIAWKVANVIVDKSLAKIEKANLDERLTNAAKVMKNAGS